MWDGFWEWAADSGDLLIGAGVLCLVVAAFGGNLRTGPFQPIGLARQLVVALLGVILLSGGLYLNYPERLGLGSGPKQVSSAPVAIVADAEAAPKGAASRPVLAKERALAPAKGPEPEAAGGTPPGSSVSVEQPVATTGPTTTGPTTTGPTTTGTTPVEVPPRAARQYLINFTKGGNPKRPTEIIRAVNEAIAQRAKVIHVTGYDDTFGSVKNSEEGSLKWAEEVETTIVKQLNLERERSKGFAYPQVLRWGVAKMRATPDADERSVLIRLEF